MTDRIIDIAQTPARLSARGSLLVLKIADPQQDVPARGARRHDPDSEPCGEVTIPFSDIAAVVAAHPQISFSRTAVTGLAQAGAVLVVCDDRFQPAAMLMPLTGHHTQAERFRIQAEAPKPVCKQLWKQVAAAKIKAQARLLQNLFGKDYGLLNLAARVKSGDPENIEGQAARIYWRRVFDDQTFVRDPDGEPPNNLLNYGYAVLRAVTARAICGAGLHPTLGIHHHNRYDPFCLASDLMEPFRPLVDRAVCGAVEQRGMDGELDQQTRAALISALMDRMPLKGESRTLFDALARLASSLADAFVNGNKKLALPDL